MIESSTKNKKKNRVNRDPWIDNVKGLLIICVILGHLDSPILEKSVELSIFYKLINFFDIPCFLFLSGFLAKRKIDQKDYRGILTRLVIPYFLIDLVFWIFTCYFPNGLDILPYLSTMNAQPLIPKFHLWYLFAVMVYYLFTPVLADHFKGWKGVIALFLCFACSLLTGLANEFQYMKVSKVIAYYPYFLTGYYFQKDWLYTFRDKLICKLAAIPVVAFGIYFFIQYHDRIYGQIFFLVKPYTDYPEKCTEFIPAIWQRGIFLVTSVIFSLAVMSLVTRRWTPFAFVGKRSLYVYIIHGFFILALRAWNNYHYAVYDLIDTNQKILYLQLAGVALAFLLSSGPFTWLFRPLLEPRISLSGKTDQQKEQKSKKE